MEYQAHYFANNPYSIYGVLADNVLHPFNEYLLLITDYGLTGFILLILVIMVLLNPAKLSSPYRLCLISLAIFSLFSYPLKYPFTWVMIAYCLAHICKEANYKSFCRFTIKPWGQYILTLTTTLCLFFLIKDIKFEYNLKKIVKYTLLGKTIETIPKYEKLYESWNGNHLFLYNYGAELNYIKDYAKSNDIFNKCIQHWNDYDIQILVADNYFNMEEWDKALDHYKLAADMCPNRFIPLHHMHKIYVNKNELDKALDMAKKIVTKKVKIPSETVSSIVNDMEKYIKENTSN